LAQHILAEEIGSMKFSLRLTFQNRRSCI